VNIQNRIENRKAEIDENIKKIEISRAEMNKPFADEEKLNTKQARLNEINVLLTNDAEKQQNTEEKDCSDESNDFEQKIIEEIKLKSDERMKIMIKINNVKECCNDFCEAEDGKSYKGKIIAIGDYYAFQDIDHHTVVLHEIDKNPVFAKSIEDSIAENSDVCIEYQENVSSNDILSNVSVYNIEKVNLVTNVDLEDDIEI
jgi:hypothetical protein